MHSVGDKVGFNGRKGRIVAARNGGMFDVQFDDVSHIERRSGDRLMRSNPGSDIYDPDKEQFRSVVQGVYESLQAKQPSADTRQLLSRAFAIATRQGQKHGWLKPGTQSPTDLGVLASRARLSVGKHAAVNRQDYERTLARARGGKSRVVTERRGRQHVQVVQPGGLAMRMNPPRSKWHAEAVAEGRSKRSSEGPLGPEHRMYHEMPRGAVRGPMSREQMENRYTATMIMAVQPNQDPDLLGYFIVVYDPSNRRAIEAMNSYASAVDENDRRFGSEWVHMPNVSAIEFGPSAAQFRAGRGERVETVVPAIHIVSHIGRGEWIVSGPMARKARPGVQGDVHDTERDALARAHELDVKAARFGVPMVHSVDPVTVDGMIWYRVVGPRESDVFNNEFEDYAKAEAVARMMDRKEASSGANPIAAKRTKAGMQPLQLQRALRRMKAVLIARGVTFMREPSAFDVDSIMRGAGSRAPTAEFLHMNMAQVKREAMRRGMSEEEADVFVEEEKARRQAAMPQRVALEGTRGISAPRPRVIADEKPKRQAEAAPAGQGKSARELAIEEALRARGIKFNPYRGW